MPLVSLAIGLLVLLALMIWLKFDAFFALIFTCVVVGVVNGAAPSDVVASISKGVGDTLSSILLILVFGAMLGKIVEESGAAKRLTDGMVARFGLKRVQYAVLLTSLLVGLPMLYNAGFLVLIPLVYVLATSTKLPLLYLGLPMCAALSVTHGFLPPHPAPTYVAVAYGANLNQVLLYGMIAVVPSVLIGGIWLGKIASRIETKPPEALFDAEAAPMQDLPSLRSSLLIMVLPVFLMLLGALEDVVVGTDTPYDQLAKYIFGTGSFANGFAAMLGGIHFLANPVVALFLAVLAGLYFLGIRRQRNMESLMKSLAKAVAGVSMILLIISAGGAFKQVLIDSGVSDYVRDLAQGWDMNPILLAWCVATLIRVAVGSATVATMTAAGMVLPIIASSGVSPELVVLATGAGSLMFSHVNDTGFWMFKEYFNLSLKNTFLVWTTMECIVGITGLLVALGLQALGV